MTAKNISSDRQRSRPVTKPPFFKKYKLLVSAVLVIVIVGLVAAVVIINPFETTDSADNQNGPVEESNPIAVFNTSKGTFKVELYEDIAPKTVENFITLVNDGFYDGIIFHRILDDFMIQAGKSLPDGTQKVSPYGNIEFEGDGEHVDGAISMASTAAGVGGTAEFFICDGAQPGLDGGYAAFGAVIENMAVVRDIADEPHDGSLEPTPENPYLPGGGKPLGDIIINSIVIENQ
jgi:peptidyl-prolyl cis-trans isomerase A (cyclophilin A)